MTKWMELVAQIVCALAAIGGLAVAAWVVISGMPARQGIDAMFLLLVALTFTALFAYIPVQAIRRGEWKLFARRTPRAAQAPASPETTEPGREGRASA